MSISKYTVGIDLGTTNCVLAYLEHNKNDSEDHNLEIFQIPQLVSPGEIKDQSVLPSFLLLPDAHDIPENGLALPWDLKKNLAIGEFARNRGIELPSKLVSSAKSWLCHSGVNRSAAILPWGSSEGTRKMSALEATSKLLEHLKEAWNYIMASDDPGCLLENQDVFLTVPASFDAVARELTVQAAELAGLAHLILLEEPQAAFYSWLASNKGEWRKTIAMGESILVFDIGGGTTDFSLIEAVEEDGQLQLKRVAVGEHLMLGGDNMDLTLAYALQNKLAQKGVKLDSWQFRGLWHNCRAAKEKLLSDLEMESEPIVVLGRGSSLIGGTIRTELTRKEVQQILLEGFFSKCNRDDYPKENTRVGIKEMGLPYESDPAITRHLAEFLGKQVNQSGDAPVKFPSAVLFNGGVMKADLIRQRVLELLNEWGGKEIKELSSFNFDLAVAQGAAYYGMARQGKGIRIRAGIARSYYIGIESAMPSVPGIPTPVKALCVVPFGMEEGSEIEIHEKEFGLVVGENTEFQLLASNIRKEDRAGEIIEDWGGEIDEVTKMETLLCPTKEAQGGIVVPVWLHTKVTEIGTLELWCVSRDKSQRWKLEFNLRNKDNW